MHDNDVYDDFKKFSHYFMKISKERLRAFPEVYRIYNELRRRFFKHQQICVQ